MSLGLVGQKRGMTRVFTEDGVSTPVTVIEVEPNRVTQIKSSDTDGYRAVQVTTGTKHRNRLTKSQAGTFASAGTDAGRGFWEFRLDDGEGEELKAGEEIKVDLFEEGQKVDVVGTTIGKGYGGVIKRHNFAMQDATHGNSLAHRLPGSIGMCQTPGRVLKGKKMSGHMGDAQRTMQNLEIVRIDVERNLMLVKGAVPGAKGGDLLISHTTRV